MTSGTQIQDIAAFDIQPINSENLSEKVLGYYLITTATLRVEDSPRNQNETLVNEALVKEKIKNIAAHLSQSDNSQLTVAIHGYANSQSNARSRHQTIYNDAKDICSSNTVFIGYRWPSENPVEDDREPGKTRKTSFWDKISFAFQSLPTLLLGIFISTLVLGIVTVFLLLGLAAASNLTITFLVIGLVSIILSLLLWLLGRAERVLPIFPNGINLILVAFLIGAIATRLLPLPINPNSLLVILSVVFFLFLGLVLALLALKLSTYPSDRYRASNYGAIDLVEFIRQVERAVIKQSEQPIKNKVKLSFIAHSLGCEVVTQAIRTLSDVFDQKAVGKDPSSDIGHVFTLGRLAMAAPDIPLESILSGRANFLRTSLRRLEEAYVFSNEGDLALRLASTAANYFSFPARTRFRGYKLGNLTAKHFDNKNHKQGFKEQKYGIINVKNGQFTKPEPSHQYLEVRASNLEHRSLDELLQPEQLEQQKQTSKMSAILEEIAVADCFTYFDCTDYKDSPSDLKGVLSQARKKSALNLWFDYIPLSFAFFFAQGDKRIDVHGGYFDGEFSQQLIYELAFLGFEEFLHRNFQSSHSNFSAKCQEKGIQVILASKPLPNK